MSARSLGCRAAIALGWLVVTVPQFAHARCFDTVPFKASDVAPAAIQSCSSATLKLNDCSAIDLAIQDRNVVVDLPWNREINRNAVVRPTSRDEVQPRVTSVPVALVVGGALIASMGITQRVRRVKALRN